MVTSTLTIYLLVHAGLFVWSFSFGVPASPRLWLLRLMLLGMAYDNLILAIGPVGVGAQWYEWANYPRYVLHAGLLPFLTLFALSAMRVRGVAVAADRVFVGFCYSFTALAVVYGMWREVLLLELEPERLFDHARLVSVSAIPPLATIATNILILPMAFALWRKSGWWPFFAAALFIFLVNGITGSRAWGFIAGNGAEVVFICCLLITERFLLRVRTASATAA